MSIVYRDDACLSVDQFIDLLNRSGLAQRRPVDNLDCIAGMLAHCQILVSAWDGERLVGIARSLTDFHYACYLSDLAVDATLQRRGVGKRLIHATQQRLGPACKIILLAAPDADSYYGPLGFVRNERGWLLARDIEIIPD